MIIARALVWNLPKHSSCFRWFFLDRPHNVEQQLKRSTPFCAIIALYQINHPHSSVRTCSLVIVIMYLPCFTRTIHLRTIWPQAYNNELLLLRESLIFWKMISPLRDTREDVWRESTPSPRHRLALQLCSFKQTWATSTFIVFLSRIPWNSPLHLYLLSISLPWRETRICETYKQL